MSGIFTIRELSIWSTEAACVTPLRWLIPAELWNYSTSVSPSLDIILTTPQQVINQSSVNHHEQSDLSLRPPPGLRCSHLCWRGLHGDSIRPKIVLWKCDSKWDWVTLTSWKCLTCSCYRSAACECDPSCLWSRHHCRRIHPRTGHLLPCHSG